ncbi:hypothetical protein [Sphingobacterium sp. SYP-B4668]|uniref:hypothetical protein n=1 Tax=Sphingobacterium sp. SYP-B4668 TaxID=2996035 RepID=UPI0022DD182D|nr:hypothetical protein [Sphingobacterium sp. SYP-B4668]
MINRYNTFTGLSYSDMKGLKIAIFKISLTATNGLLYAEKNVYIIKRDAVGYPKMIIEKDAGFSKEDKVFTVPSNTVSNDSLKRIFPDRLSKRK